MSCSSEVAMADAPTPPWSTNNWKLSADWGILTGSESGIFDDYNLSPRVRSASLSAAIAPKTTLISKLDPNSKPFSPRSSPVSQEKFSPSFGSPKGYSDFKMSPSFSNDSGCTIPDSPKDQPERDLDIQALVDRKMRTGVEKFEEEEKRRKLTSGSFSSSNSSTLSRKLQDDSVFVPNGNSWAKICSDSPLLPTPEDFPPFGPVPEDNSDNFGLRSLARIIQQGTEAKRGGVSSVVSPEELGFDRHFVENCFPKHQYMGSPFDNRVLGLLSDYHGVPEEYLNGGARLEKLPEVDFQHAPSDLLFFLFYVAVDHVWQTQAAYELFKRGWRYHKRYQIWLGVLSHSEWAGERTSSYERGRYQYFNYKTWSREVAEFTLFYEDMAGIDVSVQNQSLKRMKIGDSEFLAKAHQLAQNYQLQMARSKANPPGFYPGAWPNF